jgi:hydroxymethylglutaryl-CoA reductase (NADPH)
MPDAPVDVSRDSRQMLGANPAMRRAWLEHNTGHALSAVAETAFTPEETRGSIENLVGATQVPLGIAGPIRVNGQHADGLFFVPLATTEGTLVTTYQYGMRAITEAGGANAYVLADALDITPCFVLATTRDALLLAKYLDDHLQEIRTVARRRRTAVSSRCARTCSAAASSPSLCSAPAMQWDSTWSTLRSTISVGT